MKRILVVCLLASHTASHAFSLYGTSFYAARSISFNGARDLVGYCQFLTRANNGFEGSLFATPGYQRSFRSPRIAQYFYNTNTINITGSLVENRGEDDLLADYFGLSPSFASTVRMCPSIATSFVDFDAYACYRNFFVRVHAPVASSTWNYGMNECIAQSGSDVPFPAHYMAAEQTRAPLTSFIDAIAGHTLYGDAKEGLINSIINGPRQTRGLADFRWALGYHAYRNERYYAGFSLLGAAPTGSYIKSTYFFEPVVGNGRHWELGLGFDGRALAWESEGGNTLSFYGSIKVTHLFANTQRRSFDFCRNGFNSRYLLLKRFNDSGNYDGTLVTASTVTTLPCKVWAACQWDIVAMLGYLSYGLEIDFGYNVWIRTREHIRITGALENNRYGIKGIQNVTTLLGAPDNTTQSTATITGNKLSLVDQAATGDPKSPVFVHTSQLDPCSAAATSAFSQKFFASCAYRWSHFCHADPYIGLGGEIEFEGIAPELNRQANHNTVAQWSVWLKGGAYFG